MSPNQQLFNFLVVSLEIRTFGGSKTGNGLKTQKALRGKILICMKQLLGFLADGLNLPVCTRKKDVCVFSWVTR